MHVEERCHHLHDKERNSETADVVQLGWASKIHGRLPSGLGTVKGIGDTDLLDQLSGNQRGS